MEQVYGQTMTGRIWDLISEPARPRFIALLVLVGLGGFVELAGIAATANMMGLVAMAGQGGSEGPLDFILGWAGVEKPISRLQNGLLITVAILAFVHGYSILKSWLRSSFVWQQDQELTTRLFQACLNRPYSWFLQKNSAQLQRILSSGHITQGLINGTLSAAGHLSVALTLTLALVVADFRIAGLSFLAVASAYSLVRLFTQRTLKDKGGQAHRLDTARKTIASEALTNVRFVKAVGRESFFVNRFEEYSHGATTGMVFHSIYVDTVRAFLEWITFSGILVLSVAWVTGQDSLETLLPTLTLYTMAGYRIVPAIHELFGLWSRLKFDESFFSQVKDLLSSGPEVSGPQESIVGLKDSPVLLSLNKVSFTYDGAERQALTDLDLEVRRGQWIGVVGTTGAGKTTLLDVISGLISCQKGEVRVGHSLLNSQVAKDWQSNLGVVPQEVILLDDSLARNVAFGVETTGVDLERVHQVCHMAGLSELLESLPEGLETRLGERGTRLSGGERQRVGLARALYRKPTLLLLDEATSALDQATERRIISTFESLAQECTMVTVAHRLSSVQPCHCILVMKDGQIVERGTYQELLEHSEVFRALALM